jgi:hypothetical protein
MFIKFCKDIQLVLVKEVKYQDKKSHSYHKN